jgi:hypothetical protein
MFWFPGYRDFFLSTGACAATKEGMEHLLRLNLVNKNFETMST